MAKRKNKKNKKEPPAVVEEWKAYMGSGSLEDWQRLMRDLGLENEFLSKTQCRKALRTVWVNIPDFLDAVGEGQPVHHFPSQSALAKYTRASGRIYPKSHIRKGSPLRQLLAQIINGRGGVNYENDLIALVGGLSLTRG